MKNYYQILGVKPTATDIEIKRSYRVLAKRYHPDVNPDDATAASKFADINEANSVLSDPKARAEYDAKLKEAAAPRPSPEDIMARQRAQAQAAARQAAFRNMNMNGMNGMRRDPAAARARHNTQAVHAQAQAQAQAQMQLLINQAYQKGAAEARKVAEAEIQRLKTALQTAVAENKKLKTQIEGEAALKRKISIAENDRRELETELFNRDKEYTREKTRLQEMEAEMAELRERGGAAKRAKAESAEYREKLEKAQATLRELEKKCKDLEAAQVKLEAERDELRQHCSKLEQDNKQETLKNEAQLQLQKDKRRQLQEEIDQLNRKLAEQTVEMEALRAENEQWLQYAKSEEFLSDAEKRMQDWSKKSNADKRLAKSTLYADLGVLIWATDQEIAEAHSKLVKRYSGKAGEAIAAKLQKAEAAFEVLGDPDKRREYNATINITDERIDEERRLIAENESIMAEYRNQLASKEFWARFDDITAAAMEGDAASQYMLGSMYYSGEDIDRDLEQAAFWFKEAAKQKHADAMYYLGQCYINGEGVEKNETTGQGFVRQAAKLGSKPAQKAVGKKTQSR